MTTAALSAPALECLTGALRSEAADGNQRPRGHTFFPFGDPVQPLRGPWHLLQTRFVDWTECDVVRVGFERRVEFSVVVGGDAESNPVRGDCGAVGLGKVLLA